MAIRPIFIATNDRSKYVNEVDIQFIWFAGMSKSQKQKSIISLHEASLDRKKELGFNNILEISSKSEIELGIKLSAFNLKFNSSVLPNKNISVECIFQGSKVFQNGGPYTEVYSMNSLEAKKYSKLTTSGKLIHFKRKNEIWELEPKTLFYDWVYLNTLRSNKKLAKMILDYDAFSDIEFNPKKSINCQAASVALFVSLSRNKLIDYVLKDKDTFTEFMKKQNNRNEKKLF